MSEFRYREAQGKLLYWLRLRKVEPERWVAVLQRVKGELRLKTKWDRRMEFCARLIGYNKREWENVNLGVQEVKDLIRIK